MPRQSPIPFLTGFNYPQNSVSSVLSPNEEDEVLRENFLRVTAAKLHIQGLKPDCKTSSVYHLFLQDV